MFSLQNISCLLLVVVFGAKADAYGRRRKQNDNVDKFDVRQSRGSSVEDFDISDRRAPSTEDFGVEVFDVTDFDVSDRSSVEDFEGQERSMKINFQTPPRAPFGEITKRRPLGSWSSWTFSQKPNFKFPTRNRVKTEERPRKPKTMPASDPVNFPPVETSPKKASSLPPVKRIVIFPCQQQNLRCKNVNILI